MVDKIGGNPSVSRSDMGISAADIDWQAITEDHSRIANVANESFEVEMNIGS